MTEFSSIEVANQIDIKCWESFVSSMSTGIPDMNIPTFDPWIGNGDFPFQVTDNSISLRLEANAT